jgi:hypothetical protein
MRWLLAFLLFGLATSALAETNMQFDLKCSGTARTESQKVDGPFQRIIHVDLRSGQYCNDECSSVRKIASVDPLKITFEWGPASAMMMNRVTVDRRTGEYVIGQLNVEPNKWIVGHATCSPAPFTPFPATRF